MKTQHSPNNTRTLLLEKPCFDLRRIHNSDLIQAQATDDRVKLLLIRDLFRLNWRKEISRKTLRISPPMSYDKETIKQSMSVSRQEILNKNRDWISRHMYLAKRNLAEGKDLLESRIFPRIELCKSQKQHDVFRILRYYWSSPYSEYIGRRIRLLIRDDGIDGSPVIGIAAIGSSIIHIPDRDEWVGWDKETRTNNIIYIMDAYVLGALPPYNYLLGGKLMSYILASNEVRKIYKEKYAGRRTIIRQREADDCVCLFTTGLYGNGSQYNRMKFKNRLLYIPIGYTTGFGTLHISNETFFAMQELLMEKGCLIKNGFGDGPNWRMRVIRAACAIIGFDCDVLLRHSFKRGIYAIPLARNFRSFLLGRTDRPMYYNLPMEVLVKFWKERWLDMRKKNKGVVEKIRQFVPEDFTID